MVSHIQPHSGFVLPLCKAGLTFPTPEMCGCHLTVLEEGRGKGEAVGLTQEV